MRDKTSFQAIVNHALQNQRVLHMRPVIEKELLHYDILFALDQENLLDKLTFQGGTSLRLCYGAPRLSEDLDFVGGRSFSSQDMAAIKACIEDYIGARYGLPVSVKEPKELKDELRGQHLSVSKWQIRVTTSPESKDLPKQMIKIEIVNIPAYSREVRALYANYNFLPDGYQDTLIMVESLDEIMADKLISLVNCQAYIRYRDIWDLHWLQQQGAKLNLDFLQRKIEDYKISTYEIFLQKLIDRLPNIIQSPEFRQQMSRFIPIDVQSNTLSKSKFYPFLTKKITQIFTQVKLNLHPSL